jgi:hypothetical protein
MRTNYKSALSLPVIYCRLVHGACRSPGHRKVTGYLYHEGRQNTGVVSTTLLTAARMIDRLRNF